MINRWVLQIGCCIVVGFAPNFLDANTGIRDVLQQRIEQLELAVDTEMPLCGIYALARAFDYAGKPFNMAPYVTINYVPTANGSTPADLMQIVELESGNVFPVANLTCWDIRTMELPLIANVRSSRSAPTYDHWVCVVSHNGQLKLFDGHRPAVNVDHAEFMAMWNGYGLFIDADRQFSSTGFSLKLWGIRLATLAIVLVPMCLICWIGMRKRTWSFVGNLSAIAILSLVFAVALTMVQMSPAAWGRGMSMSGVMEDRISMKRLSLTELETVATDPSTLLIDCRLPSSFETGTINGAVGVSVGTGEFVLRELFRDIDRQTPVVLFCQSARCAFSDIMATRLEDFGFTNVAVTEKGIREYRQMLAARRKAVSPNGKGVQ